MTFKLFYPHPTTKPPSLLLRDFQNDPTSLLGGCWAFGINSVACQRTLGDPEDNLDFGDCRDGLQDVPDGFRLYASLGFILAGSNVVREFGDIEGFGSFEVQLCWYLALVQSHELGKIPLMRSNFLSLLYFLWSRGGLCRDVGAMGLGRDGGKGRRRLVVIIVKDLF